MFRFSSLGILPGRTGKSTISTGKALLAAGTIASLFGCAGSGPDGQGKPRAHRLAKGTLVKLHPDERTSVGAVNAQVREATRDMPMGLAQKLMSGELPRGPVPAAAPGPGPGLLAKWVSSHGIEYSSSDDQDQDRVYSGRVYLPTFWRKGAVKVPLVVYVHGTEPERQAVPFFNRGPEAMVGAMAAYSWGLVVAMPDLPGLGLDASTRPHAYCHGKALANCVLDMIKPALESLDPERFTWDGRIFIMGYSAGGYAALAAVKEAQTNPFYQKLSITGAACMGGPFQISKSIRQMLADGVTPFARPYIQAMLLHAYHDLYPSSGLFAPAQTFHPDLVAERRTGAVDDGSILHWLDGSLSGEQISRRIKLRLKGDAEASMTAREVLNPHWVESQLLADAWPETPVGRILKENDLVGDWVPRVPIVLAASPHDEVVPAANAVEAMREWTRMGCEAMVHLCPLTWEGTRLDHEKGAMLGLATALGWIRTHHWPLAGHLFDLWVGPDDPLRDSAWQHLPRSK